MRTAILADIEADPSIWAGLDSDNRQRIKREAMDAALGALEDEAQKMTLAAKAAACPVAERIIAANAPSPRCAADVLGLYWDPRAYKRAAAESIMRIRQNRAALGHVAPAMTAELLTHAAWARRQAQIVKAGD